MSKEHSHGSVGIAFVRPPKAAWRRWLLCAVVATIMLLAGALSPQQSQGAYPAPSRPVRGDDGIMVEGGGCGLHCTTSNTQLVFTNGNICAVCCYTIFPFTCSEEYCCP